MDDEPLARRHLAKLLQDAGFDLVGEGATGVEAIDLAERLQPDVLFLDIRMPDMTGMQAAAALQNSDASPKIVFVTGYSEYAVEAFERYAFDYLMKPASAERIAVTSEKLRRTVQEGRHAVISGEDLLGSTPLKRLPVRTDYSIKLIRVEDIECAVAKDKRVLIRAGGQEHRTYYTLTQLETLLPKAEFMRVHASAIVRLDLVDQVNFLGNHTYSITLAGGLTLPLGRGFYPDLQLRLGI